MQKKNSKTKRIAMDIAGFAMILGGLAFGWLPGPGGIPLILGGLALLANNHHWAKQLLEKAQQHGTNFTNILFPQRPLVQAAYDLGALLLIIAAGYVAIFHYTRITGLFVTAMLFFGLSVLLLNRRRYFRLQAWYKRSRKSKNT